MRATWLLLLLIARSCSAGAPTRNCTASNTGCSQYCRAKELVVPPTFKHCRLCRCRSCDVCVLAWADGFTPWAPVAGRSSSQHHASFLTRAVRHPGRAERQQLARLRVSCCAGTLRRQAHDPHH